jgi:mono/diheme cytochrome c family protein
MTSSKKYNSFGGNARKETQMAPTKMAFINKIFLVVAAFSFLTVIPSNSAVAIPIDIKPSYQNLDYTGTYRVNGGATVAGPTTVELPPGQHLIVLGSVTSFRFSVAANGDVDCPSAAAEGGPKILTFKPITGGGAVAPGPAPVAAAGDATGAPAAGQTADAAAGQTADAAAGQSVFNGTCVGCHGSNGAGALPGVPNLRQKLGKSDQALINNTISGVQTGPIAMPPRGGNPNLTNADIANVVAYMKQKFK